MSSKQFMAAFILWLTFTVMDSIVTGTFTGDSTINSLLNVDFIEWKDFLFIPIPVPNLTFITTLWTIATWNFFFFSGALEWVRTIFALTMMAGLVWAVYTQLVPILISLVSAVGTVLRSLNPFSSP